MSIDFNKWRELYNAGFTDAEIAKKLRKPLIECFEYRLLEMLPSNYIRKTAIGQAHPTTQAEFLALYELGLTDRAIALQLGISLETARRKRRALGLPDHTAQFAAARRKAVEEERAKRAAEIDAEQRELKKRIRA